MLLFPQHMEQTMLARSIEKLGAGRTLAETSAGQFPRLIKRALADRSLAEAARRFADRYQGFDQAAATLRVADRCEALLAAR
jgi:UDP:flavonoid glycosyltransferase YjiC (YdhE family)